MSERQHIPKKVRDRVKQKYGGRCAYCGCVPDKIYIDHLVAICDPRATILQFTPGYEEERSIVHDESNLMPSCFACNNYKINMDLERFRSQLSLQAERALKMSVNCRLAVKYGLFIHNQHPIVFFFEKWDNGTYMVVESTEMRSV